jgi:hypothetical protein
MSQPNHNRIAGLQDIEQIGGYGYGTAVLFWSPRFEPEFVGNASTTRDMFLRDRSLIDGRRRVIKEHVCLQSGAISVYQDNSGDAEGSNAANDPGLDRFFSRGGASQFPTAIESFCVPLTPPRVNVIGTASLAATCGTITLNW